MSSGSEGIALKFSSGVFMARIKIGSKFGGSLIPLTVLRPLNFTLYFAILNCCVCEESHQNVANGSVLAHV